MTKQIERVIDNGKPLAVIRKLLKEEFLRLDKAKFEADMRAEYDELFPVSEITIIDFDSVTELELALIDIKLGKDRYDIDRDDLKITLTAFFDYSQDENYVTFNEWINETEVVTPAVEEVLDADGMVITPAVPEITRRIREFVADDYTAQVDEFITNSPEIKAREKVKIQDIINKSTVTTAAGNVFDANLESRVNMADAILASETLGQTETVWRLADNSEITVDIAELREAHALALQSYAQIKAIGTSK
jgi:hypothetical protein